MSAIFQNAGVFKEFRDGLTEAFQYINNQYNGNGNLCLRSENPDPIFLPEKNTMYLGNKYYIFIKGFVVSFWAGLDISNKATQGEVALYFDKPSNNPAFIDLLNNHTGWKHSKHIKVVDGCRLVYRNGRELKAEDWFNFIDEPLQVLLE